MESGYFMIIKGLTKEEEAEFDEYVGELVITDQNCGDMLYKELAHWKYVKSHISKLLSKRERKVLEKVKAIAVKLRVKGGYDKSRNNIAMLDV